MSHISWIKPTRSDHPRIWVSSSTLDTIQIRATGSHSTYWSNLQTWCNSHLNEGAYPNEWYLEEQGENVGALAFSYLIAGTWTDNEDAVKHGNRAIAIANFLKDQKIPAGNQKRHLLLAMALVYDWAYDILTDIERRELRAKIEEYVRVMKDSRDTNMFWGVSCGTIAFAIIGLTAIYNDGTDAQNADWLTWMNSMLDALDNGTDDTYLPILRQFGSGDGGTFNGSGPQLRILDWAVRFFPAMQSGLSYAWRTSGDAWFENLAYWQLWHLRSNDTMHRQNDQVCDHLFSRETQAHMLQIGTSNSSTLGRVCMWIESQIDAADDLKIEGAYEIWNLLWRTTTRTALEPTIDNQGGNTLKVFETAGKVVLRDGWGADAVSLTLSAPTYYLGGHQHRDAGHFELAAFGEPIFVAHGHYCPETETEPKDASSTTETGHRYTYAARAIAKNCLLIRKTGDSEKRTLEDTSVFGVLNADTDATITPSEVGDQAWPKDTAEYQPLAWSNLDDVTEWGQATLVSQIEETDYAYVVLSLKCKYESSKSTKYRRHVLWIKNGTGTDWTYPIIVIWDDFAGPVDGTLGAGTTVLCLQSRVQSTGLVTGLNFESGGACCQVSVVSPASATVSTVEGFKDLDDVEYSPASTDTLSDSLVAGEDAVYRAQISPSAGSTTISYVYTLIPYPNSTDAPTPPTVSLVEDSTWIGVTIGGVLDAKMRKGNTFGVSVSGTEGSTKTSSTSSASTSTSASSSLTTSVTTVSAPTSPPETSLVSPPRMAQRNPVLDKVSVRLNLAGAGQTSPILAGLAGTFRVTLAEGEELQRWRIYSDNGFEKDLTWILYQDGDDSQPERTDALSGVIFGTDTDTGSYGVLNYIEWVTNYGTSKKHFWVKDSPDMDGLYIAGETVQGVEKVFTITGGTSISFGINILPGWEDEFGRLHSYSGNRWTNTLRTWGGAFTAEVFLDDVVIISERDVADIHGYYWPEPLEGPYEIVVRLRAAQASIYYVDLTGSLRVTYA